MTDEDELARRMAELRAEAEQGRDEPSRARVHDIQPTTPSERARRRRACRHVPEEEEYA